MKLSNFKAKSQATVELKNPLTFDTLLSDAGEPITLSIHGKASEKYRKHELSQTNSLIAKMDSKVKNKQTAEKLLSERVEFMANMSIGIEGFTLDDGKAINTKEAFLEIYSDSDYFWLLEQAETAFQDNSNFFKP